MKYRNKPVDGYSSRKEARRAAELKLLEKAGAIKNLREQVRFEIIPKHPPERACHYVADFVYDEKCGKDAKGDIPVPVWRKDVCEDVKGMRTREYIIKRKLMLHVHGIRIRES